MVCLQGSLRLQEDNLLLRRISLRLAGIR